MIKLAQRFNLPYAPVVRPAAQDSGAAIEQAGSDSRAPLRTQHLQGRALLRTDAIDPASLTATSLGSPDDVLKFNGTLAAADVQEFSHGLGRAAIGWVLHGIVGPPTFLQGTIDGLPLLTATPTATPERTISLHGWGLFFCKVWVF